jgi:hypothetical protein
VGYWALAGVQTPAGPIFLYRLGSQKTTEAYDEAVFCACVQGIVNRRSPELYVTSAGDRWPDYWLELFSRQGEWMHGRPIQQLQGPDALMRLGRDRIRGAVVWDEKVPATLNVATTIAGVEDAVVLSESLAEKHLSSWKLPVVADLTRRFTGKETGSAKNDAYRWAIREYLVKGRCATHWLSLYEDAYSARAKGDVSYAVTRDWAVAHRSFVFDLSPWGDERPGDDPAQPLGTDLMTYREILKTQLKNTAGREMTELSGFFAFSKYSAVPGHASSHEPVPTEWETVRLISPYNCYQNTVAGSCYNQSFQSHAPFVPLKQHRPSGRAALKPKTYLCILMADYDSATPLYSFMPKHWSDPRRGEIPLIWGIDPNLTETYPDIITHLYRTASENDYFGADASAAGYMNPNRIAPEYMQLFVRHNRKFYRQLDMTISPMVLDWDEPSPAVKDAFRVFSPDGFATIVMDLHHQGGKAPEPEVWKGMAVMNLNNSTCNFSSVAQTAEAMSTAIGTPSPDKASFHFFRIVWTDPSQVIDSIDLLRKKRPDLQIVVSDPYSFFDLFKQLYA